MAVRFGRRGGFEVRSASLHGRYELSVEWRPGCELYEPVHKLRACCGGKWLTLTDYYGSPAITLRAYFRACRVIGVGDRQKFALLREFFTPGEWPEVEDEVQRVLEAALLGRPLPEERDYFGARSDDWRFGLFEKWVRAEKGEGE